MSVTFIDPRTKRHKENSKEALKGLCDIIENVEHQVAGFAVIAWDDSGRSSFLCKAGGPVSGAALPAYCSSKFGAAYDPPQLRDDTA